MKFLSLASHLAKFNAILAIETRGLVPSGSESCHSQVIHHMQHVHP